MNGNLVSDYFYLSRRINIEMRERRKRRRIKLSLTFI